MPLPLYVPTEEQLRRASPGSYWGRQERKEDNPPLWLLLVAIIGGLGPLIGIVVYTLTR